MQAVAFAVIADGMAAREYATADDVARDEELLETILDRVQESDIDHDLHNDLLGVYVAASEVLAAASVRRPRIADMTVPPIPASVLAYMLYESDANLPTLVALNAMQPPVLFVGAVSVLQPRV